MRAWDAAFGVDTSDVNSNDRVNNTNGANASIDDDNVDNNEGNVVDSNDRNNNDASNNNNCDDTASEGDCYGGANSDGDNISDGGISNGNISDGINGNGNDYDDDGITRPDTLLNEKILTTATGTELSNSAPVPFR